jgi:hypothetical protein
MRKTWRQDPKTGKLIPIEEYQSKTTYHYVIPDQKEYRNVWDGSMISGRRAHREFLKRHDLIEVGNERIKPKKMEVDSKDLRKDLLDSMRNR